MKEVNSGIIGKDNKEIKYYNEFVLINSELKRDIIDIKYKKKFAENEYVINQGKIIISLNYHPFNQILIGSLNDINDENNFLPIAFIKFINGEELKSSFSKLMYDGYNKFIINLNENHNKIYNKQAKKEVGELFYLDENKKENNEINTPGKNEDYLKILIELYYTFDNLNFHIKDENKTLKSQENYYLINKEWINYLNKCYYYEKLCHAIKECEKNKDLIKKYRESIVENGFDSNDINYIINQIPGKIKNDIIINCNKGYDINLFKSFEKKINEVQKEIYYYDECILINERIKNILTKINKINAKVDKDVNCLIN